MATQLGGGVTIPGLGGIEEEIGSQPLPIAPAVQEGLDPSTFPDGPGVVTANLPGFSAGGTGGSAAQSNQRRAQELEAFFDEEIRDSLARGEVLSSRLDISIDAIKNFEFRNPGQIDLAKENPELSAEIENLRATRQAFLPELRRSLDPSTFDFEARREEAVTEAGTRELNRLAALGLAGTGVGLGNIAERERQTELKFQEFEFLSQGERQRRVLASLQAEASLNQQIISGITSGQQQFGQFQREEFGQKLAGADLDLRAIGANLGRTGQAIGALSFPTALRGGVIGAESAKLLAEAQLAAAEAQAAGEFAGDVVGGIFALAGAAI